MDPATVAPKRRRLRRPPRAIRGSVLVAGVSGTIVAAMAAPASARSAVDATWPPFAEVAGLLAIGAVLHREGLFAAVGHRFADVGRRPGAVLVSSLLAVAAVTAVLNLDTAAAFVTPVVILAARRRRFDPEPILYGSYFMGNAASLLLPGSNLTNLIVLGDHPVGSLTFAQQMVPSWIAAIVVVVAVVAWHWRKVLRTHRPEPESTAAPPTGRFAVALVGATVVAVVASPWPAPSVLALALVGSVVSLGRRRLRPGDLGDAVDVSVLVGLFGLAVALGTAARAWGGPGLSTASPPVTMAVAAGLSVLVNNLPAAALLSPGPVADHRALLLGLNLGPTLAVTGSLSALIWFQAARTVGASPNWRTVTRVGVVVAPLSIVAAAVAATTFAPGSF